MEDKLAVNENEELKIKNIEKRIASCKKSIEKSNKIIAVNTERRKRLESVLNVLEKDLAAKTVSKINQTLSESGVNMQIQDIDPTLLIQFLKSQQGNQQFDDEPNDQNEQIKRRNDMNDTLLPVVDPDRF